MNWLIRQFSYEELINADGITELENHHFAIPNEIMDLNNNH